MPRSARKLSNGPEIAPTAFCRNFSWSARSLLSPTTRDAADHVGMAVEIFRRRMHDDVDAEFQRPLEIGAAEGVVGDREQALAPGQRRRSPSRSTMLAAAGWSASRPTACCVSGRIAASTAARSVKSAKLTCRPAERLRTRSQQPEGAAVDVVGGDDMRAGVEQFEHGGDRRQARGEGEGRRRRFRGRPPRARRRSASGSGCGRIRSPCARRGSAGRRSRWRRSAP